MITTAKASLSSCCGKMKHNGIFQDIDVVEVCQRQRSSCRTEEKRTKGIPAGRLGPCAQLTNHYKRVVSSPSDNEVNLLRCVRSLFMFWIGPQLVHVPPRHLKGVGAIPHSLDRYAFHSLDTSPYSPGDVLRFLCFRPCPGPLFKCSS